MKRNDGETGNDDKGMMAFVTRLATLVFGMLLFEFAALFSLPQIVGEISADVKGAVISSWNGANGV